MQQNQFLKCSSSVQPVSASVLFLSKALSAPTSPGAGSHWALSPVPGLDAAPHRARNEVTALPGPGWAEPLLPGSSPELDTCDHRSKHPPLCLLQGPAPHPPSLRDEPASLLRSFWHNSSKFCE